MVKLQQGKSQFFLTIPKKIVDAIGWKKGTDVRINISKESVIQLKRGNKNG